MSNMSLTVPVKAHNTFHVRKYNKDKELVQYAKAENVVCDYFYTGGYIFGNTLRLGSGSGTPAASDVNLFNPLWNINIAKRDVFIDQVTDSNIRYRINCSVTVPASTSYVGTITELGLAYSTSLLNHAMLVDAEGNPTSIVKTDTDAFTIDIDFYIDVTFPAGMRRVAPEETAVYHQLSESTVYSYWPSMFVGLGTDVLTALKKTLYYGYNKYYLTASSSEYTGGSSSRSNRVVKHNFRMPATIHSDGLIDRYNIYFNCVTMPGFGAIPLPNPDIMPIYTIPRATFGIGDGSEKNFRNPYEYFVEGSEKVWVDGVLQTRNVDYTIDHKNNGNMLTELSDLNEATFFSQQEESSKVRSSLFTRRLPFPQSDMRSYSYYSYTRNKPLFINANKAITCNTFFVPYHDISRINNITLQYSLTGEEGSYVDAAKITSIMATEATTDKRGVTMTFPAITAQYWKVSTESLYTANMCDSISAATDYRYNYFLGLVGDPLVKFTNPPAAEAVVEIEVDMDRPFKNTNWVIDVAAEIRI